MPDLQPIGEIIKAGSCQPMQTMQQQPSEKSMADDIHGCVICQDAHFVYPLREDEKVDYSTSVPCLCIKDKMARDKRKRLLVWCELPAASESMTFENFKVTAGLKAAYDASLSVASGGSKWLTLSSGTNRGKTHLAVAVCRRWLADDKPARYAYVPLLLDELRRGYQDAANDYGSRFEMFLNIPLLVLDDLGTENSTAWVQEKLDTIIDYRLMHDLALVVTTNLLLTQMPERIVSRLRRAGSVVTISAPEYRR